MAEGGMSQSETGGQVNEPITDCDNRPARDGRTLVSLESFERSDMLPDCRGWLTERRTGERFWCVKASEMLGLFISPEGDKPMRVLMLRDFHLDATSKDSDDTGNSDAYICGSSGNISSNCSPGREEYNLELKQVTGGIGHYSFCVQTEEEFSRWSQALSAYTNEPHKQGIVRQKKISFEESRRMDSGLGEDLDTSPSTRRRELIKQVSGESDSASRDGEWEIQNELGQSRGSSFVSSLATNDDLADSRSMSDSASGDNNSTINLSEFANSENNSFERQSLSDSVFLGASQELDSSLWGGESKDGDSFISEGDSVLSSSRPPTASSTSSIGEVTDGPPGKNVICKVSRLVQRALIRRPRVSSGLTLGHIPDPRMSGPMRRKGKVRWCVLSETCLYCFKNSSPETEAETILDLTSYSVAMATEEKEDGHSIGMLKLTHSTGKKVMFSINSTDTAQLWFDYIQDTIRLANSTKAARSDSQKSTASNPDLQSPGPGSVSSRLSRESFEECYGYFERQSSLRAQRDAVNNAMTEAAKTGMRDSSSGTSSAADDKQESRSLSDFVGTAPAPAPAPSITTWESSDDLDLTQKKSHPALSPVKHSIRSSLLFKRNVRQMPIPASDIVDPMLTGHLHVYMQTKGAWKKFWVVLKDDWLYLYKKPTDTSTSDIINLPDYTIQRERSIGDHSPVANQKFMFSISHEDGSNRALMMGETDKETRAWLEKMQSRAKKHSATLDGLNLESGSSTRSLIRSESSKKWHTDQAELHKQKLLLEVLQQNNQSLPERDDPELTKRRAEILSRYQKANDEEEEELVRYLTIQNRRRMSAQVKKDVLERTKAKAKRRVVRIGSVEELAMKDQIRLLDARLRSINTDIQAKSTQQTNRLQSLKEKKEVELQLLEQKERLSRYRRLAQDALQGAGKAEDFHSALAGLDEENLANSSAEDEDPGARESLKGVEIDDSSRMPESQAEIVMSRHTQALLKKVAENSPPGSPMARVKKVLPALPHRLGKPFKPSPAGGTKTTADENFQAGNDPADNKLTPADMFQRTDSPVEKKSSPLARLRKISIGTKTAPDATQLVKETKSRRVSIGMKSSISFDEGLSQKTGEPKLLKHSSSSTDLSIKAAEDSLNQTRAVRRDAAQVSTPSPQRPRRKISVPIKMPSMENLFASSSTKKDKKLRKVSTSNAPNLNSADMRRTYSRTNGDQLHSPNSSPDINCNVTRGNKSLKESSEGNGRALRDEIDPEVLRDIEEFEMMARKALREAGWIIRC